MSYKMNRHFYRFWNMFLNVLLTSDHLTYANECYGDFSQHLIKLFFFCSEEFITFFS